MPRLRRFDASRGTPIAALLLLAVWLAAAGAAAQPVPAAERARLLAGGVVDRALVDQLDRADRVPVLVEDLYLHPELFAGIDRIDLEGRSVAAIVAERFYMRPSHGRQNFRIAYLQGPRARDLDVSATTPILAVRRYLHFPQADNAIYAELYCRTDQFVFSQTIGGLAHG